MRWTLNGLGRKKENKDKKEQSIFTKETLGVVLILFATLCLVCLITRDAVFSVPGRLVNTFLFGCFGFFAYAVMIFAIVMGVLLVSGKKSGFSFKKKTLITCAFIVIALITHVITMTGNNFTFGEYISKSYLMALGGGAKASGGGLFVSFIAYPLSKLLTDAGCYVVSGIALSVIGYLLVKDYLLDQPATKKEGGVKFKSSFVKEQTNVDVQVEGERDYPIENAVPKASAPKQKLYVDDAQDFAFKTKRELAKDNGSEGLKLGFSEGGLGIVSTPNDKNNAYYGEDYNKKLEYIKTPAKLDVDALRYNSSPTYTPYSQKQNVSSVNENKEYAKPNDYGTNDNSYTSVSDYVDRRAVSPEQNEVEEIENKTTREQLSSDWRSADTAGARAQSFEETYAQVEDIVEPIAPAESEVTFRGDIEQVEEQEVVDEIEQVSNDEIPFIEQNYGDENAESFDMPTPPVIKTEGRIRDIFLGEQTVEKESEPTESVNFTSRVSADNNLPSRRSLEFNSVKEEKPAQTEIIKKPAPPINREYFRPPFDLLESYTPPLDAPKENHEERKEIIKRTLEEFHINAVPQGHVQGPSITRYEIMMPAGVSVKKVLNFDDDLKMRLSARDGVRIEAPIPGKNLVGIEVANNVRTTVGLREVMEGSAQSQKNKGGLIFALGKDLVGNPIVDDLAKGPHYLVAGATGSGKSVCLNLMIVSLIMRYSPEDLRLILVDPKGVEFINYEHIPHLMIDEIITEPKKALAVLSWAYNEMERRFSVFRESGGGLVVDIDSYNSVVASDTVAKMPRIVIIIDELADLMETCKKDLESRIRAIAQKARAAGIHLVLATQRPSVDIITGTIKANLPSRIAFKVMNFNDSQTILSEAGAEKLLGNGDMLYKTARMSSVERYQGAYISSREVNNVVTYIKEHNKAYFDDELQDFLEKETRPKQEDASVDSDGGDDANEVNEFFLKALWLAVNTETVSISQLQRRFQIGYSRAGGLVDKMERMGFVSGNEGSKARRVLITREQFIERFGNIPD